MKLINHGCSQLSKQESYDEDPNCDRKMQHHDAQMLFHMEMQDFVHIARLAKPPIPACVSNYTMLG